MAANEYYNSFNRREDAHLPPIPSSPGPKPPHVDTQSANISPIHSPFDDQAYPAYPQASQQSQQSLHSIDSSYHGASDHNRYGYGSSDPFADNHAIPLQSKPHKMDSPQSPERYSQQDSRLYGAEEGRRRRSRRKKKKQGWFGGKIPWVVYTLTLVQVGVFIGELVRNAVLTGTPIGIKPTFNPMIGPSFYVLVNMGARYVPCMHNVHGFQDRAGINPAAIAWPCPNTTTTDSLCSLSQFCGFGGVPKLPDNTDKGLDYRPAPNQWFRFITPIFLHAGIIHIAFNMLLQMTLGKDMERQIGSIRFFLVYFSSGIFGFVLGGNYAATGIASTGASGALFGLIALNLLDLLYTWGERAKPLRDLLFILLEIAISFVLGLLPGLDNFSHIGGFLMGLVLGVCILHSPNTLRQRIGNATPYTPVMASGGRSGRSESEEISGLDGVGKGGVNVFVKQPLGFFKGRKPLWWAWWLIRAGALLAVFICFIILLQNFYGPQKQCSWCKHLSCLPVSNWCDIGNLQFTNTTTSNNKRSLLFLAS